MNRGAIWVGDERSKLLPRLSYWSLCQVQSFYFSISFSIKYVNNMPEWSPVSLHLEVDFSFWEALLIWCKRTKNWWTESLLLSVVMAWCCNEIHKLGFDRPALLQTSKCGSEKAKAICFLDFWFPVVIFFPFCFFFFELAGKNGYGREVEKFAFEAE